MADQHGWKTFRWKMRRLCRPFDVCLAKIDLEMVMWCWDV